jgi:hypothetical protein
LTLPSESEQTAVDSQSIRRIALDAGRAGDPAAQELVGEAEMLGLVGAALGRRVGVGMASGTMPEQSSAMVRFFGGLSIVRRTTIAFELAMSAGAAWSDDDGALVSRGDDFLLRQSSCIGGGTTEMAANVISERVLGMPRELSLDRDRPFRDVPRGASSP